MSLVLANHRHCLVPNLPHNWPVIVCHCNSVRPGQLPQPITTRQLAAAYPLVPQRCPLRQTLRTFPSMSIAWPCLCTTSLFDTWTILSKLATTPPVSGLLSDYVTFGSRCPEFVLIMRHTECFHLKLQPLGHLTIQLVFQFPIHKCLCKS